MVKHYPYEYTLENGTRVVVNKEGGNSYDFTLTHSDGRIEKFTYVDDDRPKTEWDEALDFTQLDALRAFWLQNEEVV